MDLECPSCSIHLYPQMRSALIGLKEGKAVNVFYQLCPKCNEPIVGTIMGLSWLSDDDKDKLTILHK